MRNSWQKRKRGMAYDINKSKRLVADAVGGVDQNMVINPKVGAADMALAGGEMFPQQIWAVWCLRSGRL